MQQNDFVTSSCKLNLWPFSQKT